MAQDKLFRRLEAKIDLLLERQGMKPDELDAAVDKRLARALDTAMREPRKLTAAEQQAIDNAPKPTPVVEPQVSPRRTPNTDKRNG